MKPILFNSEMVKAILDGRKTQTRRVAFQNMELREFCTDEYPYGWWFNGRVFRSFDDFLHYSQRPKCKYQLGDILWVRETWSTTDKCGLFPPWPSTGTHYMYRGDSPDHELVKEARWFPSIHMPKEAARIFLMVKDVRLERLRSITVEDCMWEGLRKCDWDFCPEKFFKHTECEDCTALQSYKNRFRELWNSTIKPAGIPKYGWDANPWVWVIEFERCDEPKGWYTR